MTADRTPVGDPSPDVVGLYWRQCQRVAGPGSAEIGPAGSALMDTHWKRASFAYVRGIGMRGARSSRGIRPVGIPSGKWNPCELPISYVRKLCTADCHSCKPSERLRTPDTAQPQPVSRCCTLCSVSHRRNKEPYQLPLSLSKQSPPCVPRPTGRVVTRTTPRSAEPRTKPARNVGSVITRDVPSQRLDSSGARVLG
jgi:hypothetical protein